VLLIALVVIEATLALVIYRAPYSPGVTFVIGGTQARLIAILDILTLVIGVVIGALCRTWQGAIALAMLASLPTVIQDVFMRRLTVGTNIDTVYLMTPFIVASLLGWFLRYANAEISA
jgi:hypothetical protein